MFLLLLLLTSCGSGLRTAIPGIHFNGFDAYTQKILQNSADDLFTLVPLNRAITLTAVNSLDNTGEEAEACVRCPNCWIKVNTILSYTPSTLKSLFWHEYGHCAGLRHTITKGIMYPINYGFDSYWNDQIQEFITNLTSTQ